MSKTIEKYDQPFYAAGRLWKVPSITLTVLPDDTLAVSQAEINRLHRGIANALCGAGRSISATEFEFLCDVTTTSFADVARHLEIDRSAVSRWKSRGGVPRTLGLLLKKWFWFKLFGKELGDQTIPLQLAASEISLLDYAMHEAIEKQLATAVSEATSEAA